jgi:hypothetical protein
MRTAKTTLGGSPRYRSCGYFFSAITVLSLLASVPPSLADSFSRPHVLVGLGIGRLVDLVFQLRAF